MCWYCGESVASADRFGFSDICPVCGKDLRVCKNCAFYAPGQYGDCKENISETVRDKEKRNFCDFFRIAKDNGGADRSKIDAARQARGAFDKLFGA